MGTHPKPKHGTAGEHNALGAEFFATGATGLAIEQFRIAVTLSPYEAVYWQNLGAALLESGSLDEAEEALLKAIEISPENERAHFHLGQLLRKRGDDEAAAREFDLVIKLAPGTHLAEHAGQLLHGWTPKITLGLS